MAVTTEDAEHGLLSSETISALRSIIRVPETISPDLRQIYMKTSVLCDEDCEVLLRHGSIKPEKIWIDKVLSDKETVFLSKGRHDILLKYTSCGRTYFIAEKCDKKPFEQAMPLSMKWYRNPNILPFDLKNEPDKINSLEFELPPAAQELSFKSYVGTKLTPEWTFDITEFAVNGENRLIVEVYNTLYNHYKTIPTQYKTNQSPSTEENGRKFTKSGIIGPVKVRICK